MHDGAQLIHAILTRVIELHLMSIQLPNSIQLRHAAHMEQSTRTANFWWFQLIFWAVAGTALFLSGVTQMPLMQAAIRNVFLLTAGFLSSFFLAQLIDELRWMAILRLRLASYCLAYFIALFCVVVINAIHFTLRDIALADITFGQWFSGTFNLALVYAFWSELFIQQIYVGETAGAAAPPPDNLVVEHQGRLVSVPLANIVSIIAAGDYVEIKTPDRSYLDRQALHKLAENLGDDAFPRVHRSRLVNRNHVESVTPLSKGRYRLHLMDGSSMTTSRGYRETVQSNFLAGIV